ncbi:hypothetical protein HYX58_04045 [Candidatus Dependentiae bacterium]|nr:hypothetical protein [Candidatus Dependentiae bacterium]
MNFITTIFSVILFNLTLITHACLPRWVLSVEQKYAHPARIEMDPKDEPAQTGEVRIFIKSDEFDDQETFSQIPINQFEERKKVVRVETRNPRNLLKYHSYYEANSFAHHFGKKEDVEHIGESFILGKKDLIRQADIRSYALYEKQGTQLHRLSEWPRVYDPFSRAYIAHLTILVVTGAVSAGIVRNFTKCLGYY